MMLLIQIITVVIVVAAIWVFLDLKKERKEKNNYIDEMFK